MVHLIKKKIKGKIYLYLQETARIDGKSKRIWQRYIGPEEKIRKMTKIHLNPDFTIKHLDFGLPASLLDIATQLELVKIIDDCVPKRNQGLSIGHYILFAAFNRCIKPTSKTQMRHWFENTIFAKKFPKIDTYFDAKAYSNHFHYLTPSIIEDIETRIHQKLIKEFNVDMSLLFYDPTNFFTYINPKESQMLPRHGHSKENRSTLNLVGLALFCTNDGGIPLLHDVYPGNVQDARLFRNEILKLKKRLKKLNQDPRDLCLVFDKGNLSDTIFSEIDGMKVNFVASIRPSTQKDLHNLTAQDFTLEKLPNLKKVGVLEYKRELYGKTRRLIVVYNPKRSKWQGNNLICKLNKKIEEVNDFFAQRLNVKKWRNSEAIKLKIDTIIKTKQYFQWINYFVSGSEGKISYSISLNQSALQSHLATLGKSFIFSNHPKLSAIDLVWLYRQQYTVERAFKYIKSPNLIQIRPMFHRNDDSVRGHLFVCVIGLLLLTLLARKVNRQFPEFSLPTIVNILSEIGISLIKFSGSSKIIRKLDKFSADAAKLCDYLGLNA